MIRRLSVPWPAPRGRPLARPIRLLAVSDERDEALLHEANRLALGKLDAIIGAGDLEPDYLAMLGDAFCVPLLYVLGNHDRGLGWQEHAVHLPAPLDAASIQRIGSLEVCGLSWPGQPSGRPARDEWAAWQQVLRIGLRRGNDPTLLVVSHVPPEGAGDDPADPYHRGFRAYRWLANRVRPALWLHGHTTVAARNDPVATLGQTQLLNVTGGVLLELQPTQQSAAA